MMDICQVCGNEIAAGTRTCPFCGSRQSGGAVSRYGRKVFCQQVVNIERGMPVVEDALRHLSIAVVEARRQQVQILLVIHGYGSSGRGGRIRRECRKSLDFMCSKGELNSYLPGEDFFRKNGQTKALLQRYPQLAEDRNLDKGNQGVTLVVL